jgi:hypothetical protein
MHVRFLAALDAVDLDGADRLGAAVVVGLRAGASLDVGRLPRPQLEAIALAGLAALGRGDTTDADGRPLDGGRLPDAAAGLPVFGVRTPVGVDLGASTLEPSVRAAIAGNLEPPVVAVADGGWRRPVAVFRPDDDLATVRVTPRRRMPFAAWAELRELLLDHVADRSAPLLVRLTEMAALVAVAVDERGLPDTLPGAPDARTLLSLRAHLEARMADVDVASLVDFVGTARPLFDDDLPLADSDVPRLFDALHGDWRATTSAHLVPAEAQLGPAIEGWLAQRVFGLGVDRDLSVRRAFAELLEALAGGLRLAAALATLDGPRREDGQPTLVSPVGVVAALALAEHHVATGGQALPVWTPPRPGRERGPRMADLDLTLASLC